MEKKNEVQVEPTDFVGLYEFKFLYAKRRGEINYEAWSNAVKKKDTLIIVDKGWCFFKGTHHDVFSHDFNYLIIAKRKRGSMLRHRKY